MKQESNKYHKLNKLDIYYYYDDRPKKDCELPPGTLWYAGASFQYTDRPIKYLQITGYNGKTILVNLTTAKVKELHKGGNK